MTILERLLGHDAWTTRQLLLRCRELSAEQMDRRFDIGDRSLRETFAHIIGCMEAHTNLLIGRTSAEQARDGDSVDGMLGRLTTVAKDFTEFAMGVEREGRANEIQDVIEGDTLGWESQARGWGWSDGGSYGGMVAG